MLQNLSGWHALVILTIVLLIFGSAKLPTLAKSVGQSVRILKDEVHETTAVSAEAAGTETRTPPTAPVDAVAERRAS
ncbi:twin-arginine translocase TatA/TatE family subunit [Nocardioides mangrovi]|uniref:Sec-independent protein translocase protein TatA n=1 Tax=Nocardioides mangrovi TaxID=2874580 RepID=A0ABS7UCQ6_9ACTN|nr:twin-arginine translocase TatA/TatE family subunit [Nocardioides mangrovi]MBZ5738620.1 twin-arginine translocase TatA/TatE family subunit [Nocardioides mangrovi]